MLTLQHSLPITVVADAEIATRRAAHAIIRIINTNDTAKTRTKIGFATGNTMIPLYAELVKEHKRGHVSFKNVVGVNLDEYAVAKDHPDSYHTYMHEHLYNHVDIDPSNVHLPNGGADDLRAACAEYEAILKGLGELDVQLLGIGRDGHIGFNEPPAAKSSGVHVEKLDISTVMVNNPPSQTAITMGVANILNSKAIILVITGEAKADVMCKLVESQADNPLMPASYVKSHPNTMVICDWDAVSKASFVRAEVNKMVKRGAMNAFSDVFAWGKHITVMSPHPDDDVIGVGGTMARYSGDCEISVVYQTSGRNAVGDASLQHHVAFVESIFKKPKISEKLITMGIRRAEAKVAAQICGISDVEFMEMPFYRRKRREKKPAHVEDNDVVAMMKIIQEKKPDVLIINGDTDPNRTHVHCKTAITRALERINGPRVDKSVDKSIDKSIDKNVNGDDKNVNGDDANNANTDNNTNSTSDNVDNADNADDTPNPSTTSAPAVVVMTQKTLIESLEVMEAFEDIDVSDVDNGVEGNTGVDNNIDNNDNNAESNIDNNADDIDNVDVADSSIDNNITEDEKTIIYEYCSAWGEFSLSEVDVIIPLTEEQLQIKEQAILAHESQNPPIAHNGVVTPFHERANTNARDAIALLRKMGFDYSGRVVGIELLRKLDY